MIKKVLMFGVAIMTALLAVALVWQFRMAVIYVLISLALAAALRPLVQRLAGRRFMVRMAWLLLYLAVLGSFGFLLFLAGKAAISEIQQFAQTVSVQDAWKLPAWLEGSSFQQTVMERLPVPSKLFEAVTGSTGQLVLPALLGFTQGFGSLVSASLVILFLSIYWSINQIHFERLWLSLLPSSQRTRARGIWRTIEPDLGAYIRSEVIQSLLAGLLLGLGYWLLGSPYPILLALIGALAWLIPIVGAPLAVILPLALGLLTSVQFSLFTALFTLAVLIALEVWVEPRLFRRKWNNPLLTLVILLAMADAFGLLGILIAPPLSAVCQILWNLLVSHRVVSGAAVQVSDLKERQARVWGIIKAMDRPPIAMVSNSMQRLTHLIENAEPILQATLPAVPSDPFHPLKSEQEK
ncbi:MAG TPA: AI-2E family transporter [Anaerolineales bacterium]